MNSWKSIKLSDVCYFSSDKIEVSNLSLDNYVSTENMLSNKSGICRAANLPNTSLTVAFNFGDILLSNIRPYFKKIWLANFNGGCSNDVLVLKAKESIDAKFLYYILSDNKFFDYDTANAKGTKMPRGDKAAIMNYEFSLPPLDVQKKIAGVLGALDDKIELNNKINNNLEQQAQALFKSWFVDIKETSQSNEKFGYIPQNATVKKVGELPVFITDYVANGSFASLKENVTLYQNKNYAYFIRNTDLKSNSFEVYVDEHSYKFLSKSSLFGNEIIISNVGDVGSVFLCPKLDLPMTLGNNIIMLRAETDSYLDFYLYIWFKWSYGQELIQGIKGGSAQPKFNKTDFKGLPVILPSQQQLKEFNAAVTPVFNKISQNNQENIRLVQLRDTLLPKLMSGEIDVSNVDISALTSTDKLSFTE